MKQRKDTSVRSQVDVGLTMDPSRWVLSMVRKSEGNNVNPQHAFLLVEGTNERYELFIRRYDLFIDDNRPGYALIVNKEQIDKSPTEIKIKFNQLVWKEPNTDKELYYKSWNITPSQGRELHEAVLRDKSNLTIKYNSSGIESVSGASGSSGSQNGQSCFTWARDRLRGLNDTRISADIESKWIDKVIAVTSVHLPPKAGQKSESCCVMM